MLPSGSPRSSSPKAWGVGGSSPVLPARTHHRGIVTGVGQALRGSPLPSRPPHLPHPRSRSLDTALDRASDSTTPMATPQCGSVAGSLTDNSTVPDSVTTDSVTDMLAASDTDASDSGIFSRYNIRDSKGDVTKSNSRTNPIGSKLSLSDKESVSCPSPKSAFHRANKTVRVAKEDLTSTGRHKTKIYKNSSNVPSGKEKNKQDCKPTINLILKTSEERPNTSKNTNEETFPPSNVIRRDRPLFIGDRKDKYQIEVDPYNNFFNKNIVAPKSLPSVGFSRVEDSADKVNKPESVIWKEKDRKQYKKQNPYISPVISLSRRELSPQPSSSASSSPSVLSIASAIPSPSLISASSTASLPYNKKDFGFNFPKQTNTLAAELRKLPTDNLDQNKFNYSIPLSEKNTRFIPRRTWGSNSSSSASPTPKSDSEGSAYDTEKYSSPIDGFKCKKKPLCDEIDINKEGSHIDLVASCEKYLRQDEQYNPPSDDDDSTVASTRRSSMSSLSSTGDRRRRRLSSIPLEDELIIAEEDFMSSTSAVGFRTNLSSNKSSPQKSCSPHEMAIFSAIAALSQVGNDSPRDKRCSGDYEGFSTDSTLDGHQTPTNVPVGQVESLPSSKSSNVSKSSRTLPLNTLSPTADAPLRSIPGTIARNDSVLASSSLLDKCVSRVKTFIKK